MLCLIAAGLLTIAHGEEPAGWVTKSFPMRWEDVAPPVTPEGEVPPLVLPPLPVGQTSGMEWERVIKTSSEMLTRIMQDYLPVFPAGTTMLYDPATETLAVRTTQESMQVVEILARELLRGRPWQPVLRVFVYELDQPVMRDLLLETAVANDHVQAWNKVEALTANKKATLLDQIRLPVRSGFRASADSGCEKLFPEDKTPFRGLSFEMEPVINSEGRLLTCDYRLTWSPPLLGAMRKEHPLVTWDSYTSMIPGQVQLIGAWNEQAAASKKSQCAFLLCGRHPGVPKVNEAIRQVLIDHSPPPLPVSKATAPEAALGMKLGTYRVPRSYLALDQDPVSPPMDPFATSSTTDSLRPKTTRKRPPIKAAQHILEMQGILFPAGSFAAFHPGAGVLLVKNQAANLDQVEAFVWSHPRVSPTSRFTIHLVEADSQPLRELSSEAAEGGDHTVLLQKLSKLPDFRWIESIFVDTMAGRRAGFSSGWFNEPIAAAPLPESKITSNGEGNTSDQPVNEKKLLHSGIQVNLDSVLGPDGTTTNIILELEQRDEEAISRSTSATGVKLNVSTVMTAGTTRWIATWRPPAGSNAPARDKLRAVFLTLNQIYFDSGSDF
ncbi:hypothetical protein [Verrucomicrobium sp. BvORR034]|uniref:hypothetical protein n=1 Tax=Verrucomicrobium sp. BvORR034 TaxID=1396418 RepID=UPI002240F7CD|nr:hypothetical protein [Verrucomicrobium sp. BvORR034]